MVWCGEDTQIPRVRQAGRPCCKRGSIPRCPAEAARCGWPNKMGRAMAVTIPDPWPQRFKGAWSMGKSTKIVRTVKTTKTVRIVRTVKTVRHGSVPRESFLRGPSLLDGQPIVAVAVNLARKSKNPKTGNMVGTYILADGEENPITTQKTGGDASICGNCPHRGGTCYVNVTQALVHLAGPQEGRLSDVRPEEAPPAVLRAVRPPGELRRPRLKPSPSV